MGDRGLKTNNSPASVVTAPASIASVLTSWYAGAPRNFNKPVAIISIAPATSDPDKRSTTGRSAAPAASKMIAIPALVRRLGRGVWDGAAVFIGLS